MSRVAISNEETSPKHAAFHLVKHDRGEFLFEVATGKIVDLTGVSLREAEESSDRVREPDLIVLQTVIRPAGNQQDSPPPKAVALQSLSLAIANKCNLGCTYCYAEQGTFGGRPDNMSIAVAKASVDRLFKDAPRDQKITLAFMGGEPLFNRQVLHEATAYAAEKSATEGREVAFTLTTNATLIRPEDVALFQRHRFTVTVSIDGIGESNDVLRPDRSGRGTYERIKERLQLLVAVPQRKFRVSARVTVTPKNINLPETFRGLMEMGFDSIQFSPMVKSPSGREEMSSGDFDTMLQQLVACGEMFREGFQNRRLLPLLNVLNTLKRIHDYRPESYPCGAGGGYMGVSAEGGLYACHRFVDDEVGHLGDLASGVSPESQENWLKDRHLSAQGACNSCWARYLCSGSCHHEVIKRGRPACDYIRGWLYYCLALYNDLRETDPTALRLLLGTPTGNGADVENEDGTGIEY